ncbi:hypothetical protein K1719_037119 [Acacia pycnantha]|nr:hypothetical protein K1719_037119 [Acacia pycnantha]
MSLTLKPNSKIKGGKSLEQNKKLKNKNEEHRNRSELTERNERLTGTKDRICIMLIKAGENEVRHSPDDDENERKHGAGGYDGSITGESKDRIWSPLTRALGRVQHLSFS